MKDFLGNELKAGDKIVISTSNVFDEELLEIGEVIRLEVNIWDHNIVIYKDEFGAESYVREYSVMKIN